MNCNHSRKCCIYGDLNGMQSVSANSYRVKAESMQLYNIISLPLQNTYFAHESLYSFRDYAN